MCGCVHGSGEGGCVHASCEGGCVNVSVCVPLCVFNFRMLSILFVDCRKRNIKDLRVFWQDNKEWPKDRTLLIENVFCRFAFFCF